MKLCTDNDIFSYFAEENQKRQQSGYGQVGFNYDASSSSQQNASEESSKTDDDNKDDQPDEVYVPHPRFYIPPDMEIVSQVPLFSSKSCEAICIEVFRFIFSRQQQNCKQSLKKLLDLYATKALKWKFS